MVHATSELEGQYSGYGARGYWYYSNGMEH